MVGRFVDHYVIQNRQYYKAEDYENDYKRNYGQSMMFVTMLILQLKDTAKEGDGDRNLINHPETNAMGL